MYTRQPVEQQTYFLGKWMSDKITNTQGGVTKSIILNFSSGIFLSYSSFDFVLLGVVDGVCGAADAALARPVRWKAITKGFNRRGFAPRNNHNSLNRCKLLYRTC